MILVEADGGRMQSVGVAMLKAFQEVFGKLLNKAIIANKMMIVKAVCVERRKGTAQRRGQVCIGIPATNALLVDYQYTDNSTCYRYRVFVPSDWIRPEELRQKLIEAQRPTATAKVEARLLPKLPQTVVSSFVPQPVSPVQVKSVPHKKVNSLRGFTKDPEAVEILLMDLGKIAKEGIVTRVEVIKSLNSLATNNAYSASQAFRRIVEANILVKAEGGYKISRLAESKIEVTIATKVMELKAQSEQFEAISASVGQAEDKVSMLNRRRLAINEELAKIDEELKLGETALMEVREKVAPGSSLAKAHEAFLKIQEALK